MRYATWTRPVVPQTPEHQPPPDARDPEDRNRHAWHLALSGLRRGEIGGLRWTNIDLEAKTLTIGTTRISVDGKAVEQDDAKSEDSQRVLPIPEPLLIELKAAKKRQASEKLTLGAAHADLGYVVCNEAGQPYHPTRCPRCGPKTVAAAGVPRIRLHDARHTCGTTMHLQGVPAAVIAAWLGHADVAFTMRTYVHSQPDALADGAHCLPRRDAPIPVKRSSGGEPLAVVVGEVSLPWRPRSSRETVIIGTPK
jgi:integrase